MEMGLALLLRVLWLAGILPIVLISLPFFAFRPLRGVLMSFAGRSKLITSSQSQGSLRRHSEEKEYKISQGDSIDLVSCPHYLVEIVIYTGILIATEGSDFTVWLLFGFVVANLVFVAGETQSWYICKFNDYPHSRGAIFPHVY